MDTVGIREFRENLSGYLGKTAPVAITRHGETIGFYLPAARKRTDEEWAEFDRAAARLDHMIAETGLSEEELVEDFKKWRASQKHK
jgi:antitoxin (DNA-binding transcriptional repressor) of toxin-antitoxin stability system